MTSFDSDRKGTHVRNRIVCSRFPRRVLVHVSTKLSYGEETMTTSLFGVFRVWSRWILNATLLFVLPLGLNAQSRPTTQSGINASSSQVQIMTTASTDSSASVRVSIPGTPEKFSAHLNGKDVSSRFSSVSCDGATCKTATFTQADGFRTEFSPSMRAMG
jgi:hypothetical protein